MKALSAILFMMLLLNLTNASCSEGQIDINSASKEELDSIVGIGPKIAEYIIEARPFESVEDLINVYRIGNITLQKIKEQGLACVENDEEKKEKETIKKKLNYTEEKEVKINFNYAPKTGEIINLLPKDIKKENNSERLNKSNYALYGFISFSFLLGLLFILKWKKNKDEIE
jgi:competence ComEA-like helix-hairpin-helix protein